MIEEILARHDTDKNTTHSYGPMYGKIFSDFDRQSEIDLLEIGVWHGGSLAAWREYFPNATITGVEVGNTLSTDCIYIEKDPKMSLVVSDIKKWEPSTQFDIVIDDGSHDLSDVLWVASHYPSKLKQNGVLVIEDIKELEWGDKIRSVLPEGYSFTIVDFRIQKGRSDDIAVIIRKI